MSRAGDERVTVVSPPNMRYSFDLETPKSRHERYAHPKPVLTCPRCIWRLAGDLVQRKVNQ